MVSHGRGPKDVLVKRYPRWRDGKRHWVQQALRSNRSFLSLRKSKDQFDFGFD
jgi:hypothetical protein